MVNTRGKIRYTQHTRKTLFSQTSITVSDHQSTDSGALIGSNEDLLSEILLRLPVTSVLRLKSIPFDVENRNTPPFHKLDFCNDLKGLRIEQSCKGLLLCCRHRGSQRASKYYVFNPTTNQFAIIPCVPRGTDVRKTICSVSLAYNKEDFVDYKVVCICRAKANGVLHHIPDQDLFQIQIHSSDTGKWKIVIDIFSADLFSSCGVYWNGAIHWVPSRSDPLYVNLEVEQLRKLPLPEMMYSLFYFGESRGHLHMAVRPNPVYPLHLNVYEMLSGHSGWLLKYQVELDEVSVANQELNHKSIPPFTPRYYEFEVLDVVSGEKEEDTFMVVIIPAGKIIRYNVLHKSFNQIYDLKVYDGYIGKSLVHRYTETKTYF